MSLSMIGSTTVTIALSVSTPLSSSSQRALPQTDLGLYVQRSIAQDAVQPKSPSVTHTAADVMFVNTVWSMLFLSVYAILGAYSLNMSYLDCLSSTGSIWILIALD
jgi:hypothetical protein